MTTGRTLDLVIGWSDGPNISFASTFSCHTSIYYFQSALKNLVVYRKASQDYGWATFGKSSAFLVTPLQEGYGGFREGAEVYQNDGEIGGISYREKSDTLGLLAEAEGKPDSSR